MPYDWQHLFGDPTYCRYVLFMANAGVTGDYRDLGETQIKIITNTFSCLFRRANKGATAEHVTPIVTLAHLQ